MQLPIFNDESANILPFDGEAYLYTNFLKEERPYHFFNQLLDTTDWKQEGMKMYGKHIEFPRLTAWYGDEGKVYKYSGLVNVPIPFTGLLLEMKQAIESKTGFEFNAALLNLYRSEKDSMGWHSDDEAELGINPVIASLSFGETRNFQFKHKTVSKTTQTIQLSNNRLLLMKGTTQHNWLHQIPKSSKPAKARINITFRKIG
jgi:alkylated DNA repair dioxygenase AlkB